jgi:hypothetical protein
MSELNQDDELLASLGVEVVRKKISARTPREERIIAGFEDILRFYEAHGRAPQHGEERDIFERLYAVRLDRLREQADCRSLLAEFDVHGLLDAAGAELTVDNLDDDALLAELGVDAPAEVDITNLTHVKSRDEIRAAEEVASRTVCSDFETFRPLFRQVKADLDAGIRQTRKFMGEASIKQGEFFILGGILAHVADMGHEFVTDYGRKDRRLRVIYDNGTESDILLRSFQRGLNKDEGGRRVTDPSAGPLFGGNWDQDDIESGTIYVLRSLSDHPFVAEHRKLIHKIGVTGGKVETRIANAALDATYLLADVEVVATYKLADINRTKLENLFHRMFSPAQLDLTIHDRFGNPVRPKEWFLVPLAVIDEVVSKIRDGSIVEFIYDPKSARLVATK